MAEFTIKTEGEHSERHYDMCIIFPTDPRTGAFSEKSEAVLKKIIPAVGKENMHMYFSVDRNEIITLLRLSEDRAKFYSDAKNIPYLADEKALEARAKIGWPEDREKKLAKVDPLQMSSADRPDITRFRPYETIYLRYELEPQYQELYAKNPRTGSVFSHIARLKVLQRLLEEPAEEYGLDLRIDDLKHKPKDKSLPVILDAFPLHNQPYLAELKKILFSNKHLFPWTHPFDIIKDYFGEKITLYYKFVGHFSLWLLFPALVGLAFELVVAASSEFSHPIIPFFSLFIVVWGVFMLEFWKREEKFTALKWGMIGYENIEPIRAEFSDYEKISLTGEEILYFSLEKKRNLLTESFSILILLCFCVIGTTAAIYNIRAAIAKTNATGSSSSSIVASILNTIQIQVWGYIYSNLSEFLTDRENHMTNTQYEDSMIAKNFIFSFINSYSSFFFLAFFAEHVKKPTYPGQTPDENVGMCGASSCMETLGTNLGIVLGSGIIVNNTVGILMPLMTLQNKHKKEMKEAGEGKVMTFAEKEASMAQYNFKSLIGDYMSIAILFGFMTLFISALPGAAFASFLALWAEVKADAWRMTSVIQRPWPTGAEDIGTWQTIFDLVIAAAVVTNGAMIVFTMSVISNFDNFTRFWIFIGFQWVVFIAQYVVRALIPDVPLEVQIQEDRTEYLNSKLIDHEADDTLDVLLNTDDAIPTDGSWDPNPYIQNTYVE